MLAHSATLEIVRGVDLNLPSHFRLCGPWTWKTLVHAATAGTTPPRGRNSRAPSFCKPMVDTRASCQVLCLISCKTRLASLIVYVGLHKPLRTSCIPGHHHGAWVQPDSSLTDARRSAASRDADCNSTRDVMGSSFRHSCCERSPSEGLRQVGAGR